MISILFVSAVMQTQHPVVKPKPMAHPLPVAQQSKYGIKEMEMLKLRYAGLNKAIQTNNFAGFKQWLVDNTTGDFFLRSGSGSINTLSQTISLMKDQFLILKSVKSSTFSLGNLAVHPTHISVSVKSHLDAMTKDNRHLVQDSLAVDTWKLVNKNWRLSSLVTTKSKVTVNGKPLRTIG